jgi:hypothetical protein
MAARKKLAQLFPKRNDWEVADVRLGWAWKPDHWYYQITFSRRNTKPREGEGAPTFSIVVLMNGAVIEPTVMNNQDAGQNRGTAP